MSLRTVDDREVRLRDRLRGETIARLPFADALRDAHPGAIYFHQGTTYEVAALETDRNRALLERTDATYYTRALTDKTITVERDRAGSTLDFGGGRGASNAEAGDPDRQDRADGDRTGGDRTGATLPTGFADVTLREQVSSYMRYDGDESTEVVLDEPLPETRLRTRALYFTIPAEIEADVRGASDRDDGLGFPGAIHAVEHALISLFPLALLCDRRDVGGLSTPLHPHTDQPTVFVYDGYPGGVGLARGGYDDIASLLYRTHELLRSCSCESGCPSCVQSPHCGNANRPLDKDLARRLLDGLLGGSSSDR